MFLLIQIRAKPSSITSTITLDTIQVDSNSIDVVMDRLLTRISAHGHVHYVPKEMAAQYVCRLIDVT